MESDCKTERARPPLSPLPNALRCCPRDDTVCTYCGVSYLVLHEIADLEAKILLLEKNQDGEVEWARGALQAACQALVERELSSARASAESRIQALAEVYDQERAETRDQQRQSVGLQEEAERCRREAEHARREADQLTASLQEARTQAEALRTQVGEEAVRTARGRDKLRMLTGQAELWRGVARSLEEEKVVQEKMLSELKEQLRQLRVAKAVEPSPQRDEEEKRRVATECVSLRGALRDSQEEIASLRGQRLALQVGTLQSTAHSSLVP
ncbi:translation initiation factor IF-2-like [Thrips palmi]|uniref:Translation initiation factor IF-2-like n=1 Tax=Thrips palmi TaxID=161013 RepID=A0A6P8ZMD7_THRPL|nr:translation initiation factor IF-2-like [Thrips palmi]